MHWRTLAALVWILMKWISNEIDGLWITVFFCVVFLVDEI